MPKLGGEHSRARISRALSGVLFLVSTLTCATRASILKSAPAKPYPCDLQIFHAEEEVTRAYERLCVIAVDETAMMAWEDAGVRVADKTRKAACRCGADAVIVRQASRGLRQARIDSVAIRFTGSPPEEGPSVLKARLYNLAGGELLVAEFTYDGSGKGLITMVRENGERCIGEYTTLVGGTAEWGSLYSRVLGTASFDVETVARTQRGTAIATGENGTVIQCEYVSEGVHGHGACADNRGALYRLMY